MSFIKNLCCVKRHTAAITIAAITSDQLFIRQITERFHHKHWKLVIKPEERLFQFLFHCQTQGRYPDLIMIDANVNEMDGIAFIKYALHVDSKAAIIIVGQYLHDHTTLQHYFRAGAKTYIDKNADHALWSHTIDALFYQKAQLPHLMSKPFMLYATPSSFIESKTVIATHNHQGN
jgi:DNA-binding NarL/FixJ family response regulator